MRHRRRGRKLGRNPKHQRALLRNLACALILTERDDDTDAEAPEKFTRRIATLSDPGVSGRIVTTLAKAKEVQPLVERCVAIARRALPHQQEADNLEPDVERGSQQWHNWRKSEDYYAWNQAIAPVVAARRRVQKLLGDKLAVWLLFEKIAPRFEDRNGGYTRVLRLAQPRLGDAGTRAVLEFVGTHDRQRWAAPRPAFEPDVDETGVEEPAPEETPSAELEDQAEETVSGAEEATDTADETKDEQEK